MCGMLQTQKYALHTVGDMEYNMLQTQTIDYAHSHFSLSRDVDTYALHQHAKSFSFSFCVAQN